MMWIIAVGTWLSCGFGVSFAMHIALAERFPDDWKGAGKVVIGMAVMTIGWPAVIVSLITLALLAAADK